MPDVMISARVLNRGGQAVRRPLECLGGTGSEGAGAP